MTVLVTGASGAINAHLMPELSKHSTRVKALVRSETGEAAMRVLGVEPIIGDLLDVASLDAVFSKVETLFLLTPAHPNAVQMARNAIQAAKAAGVGRIVRLSAIKASVDGPTDNTRQHWLTEEDIRASGIPYTILRPHFFMQNLLASVPAIVSESCFYYAVGDARIGMIDTRDIAEAALQAILLDRWVEQTLELTGPQSISMREVAKQLSEVLDRPVRYVSITPEELAASARQYGATEWMAGIFSDYNRAYGARWGDFTTECIDELVGRPARSFNTFAEEVMAPAVRLANSSR